jgi:hypothetical protein
VLVVASGCSRDGGDGAVCHDAADLCGASGDFDEDDCTGDQKAYAECIVDRGECEPHPVAPTYFQVEDEAANLHAASGGFCSGGEMLATGGSESCELQFTIGAAAPVSLVYRDVLGRDAEASLEGLCSAQPEVTEAACSDGCSNDDDDFIDCDDYDCCDVVDCPSTTSCGQEQECVEGPEDTAPACSDGCSNDADSFVDCEDYDCCDAVACAPGTACGDR